VGHLADHGHKHPLQGPGVCGGADQAERFGTVSDLQVLVADMYSVHLPEQQQVSGACVHRRVPVVTDTDDQVAVPEREEFLSPTAHREAETAKAHRG